MRILLYITVSIFSALTGYMVLEARPLISEAPSKNKRRNQAITASTQPGNDESIAQRTLPRLKDETSCSCCKQK
jgi:hypothetical protein